MYPSSSQFMPERTAISGSLVIPRMVMGLWQLADQNVNIVAAAQAMESLIDAGFDCFDMADHYGDAELVIGQYQRATFSRKPTTFTKWCPQENDIKTFEQAETAVDLALARMHLNQIPLMQYHVWDYTDNTFLHNLDHLRKLQHQGKIAHIGLTNVDAAHLELLINSGFNIATNQVSCSVIDRRAHQGRLFSACKQNGVDILAYGTLLGGFISEKWLGVAEPTDLEKLNASLRKYLRFIKATGGWEKFQVLLEVLSRIAKKHKILMAAVATRYVLQLPSVTAVIVGSRLSASSKEYTARNLATFSFVLDSHDLTLIAKAQENLLDIPGDTGDEYRRPPYLTATGDLSQHIKKSEHDTQVAEATADGSSIEYSSGSPWEGLAGYSRAVRTGNTIHISGITASSPIPGIPVIGGNCARSQAVAVLDIIERAIKALKGSLSDVVCTRIMVQKVEDAEEISRAHEWAFRRAGVRPANTLVVAGLIGAEFLVEIEVEAEVGYGEVLTVE